MQPSDPMQDIFDQAEALTDVICNASGCNSALIGILEQMCQDMPEIMAQAQSLIRATDLFLTEARRQADSIARLTFDQDTPGSYTTR